MCWSLEVSVLTGAAAWVTAGYIMKRNVRWDRASALFLMAVSSMQFADAFLWWDGMAKGADGTCSTTNWVTSVIFIPLILRAQLAVRQMEMRFKLFTTSVTILVCAILVGLMAFSGTWAPAAAWHYFTNRACSTASLVEHSSPLWGGINMPIFCFIIYFCLAMPPMLASGRAPECLLFVGILSTALSFEDAWSSKFCSLACALGIWYLFYSGPPLPPHTREHVKEKGATRNPFLKFAYAYEKFCFGTAKA
ncbi:hypothetical protein JKP88DRAFT_313437 [Tribonema minus]|uniref:Uncharacterized protein n=1 Tax=Tribonema minus TaxID=303371 RepID=A0A835Z0X8_9STRA|nr:hypothetical protein JKP88DRAFT_313437 [Tribonema minus]